MRITLFWRLLASDIHFGFRAIAGRLAIVFVTGVTLCVLLFVHTAGETPHIFSLGFADYYAALFAGIQEYHPQQGTPFKLPAGWLCMGALAAYVVLGYPTRDLNGIGMQTLAASGNRWFWWLSKCIWTLLACFAFWFVTLAACATVTIALGIPFTLKLSPELPDLLRFFCRVRCGCLS